MVCRSILMITPMLMLLTLGEAQAYCSEPSMYATAPSAPGTYTKPSPPYCLSGYQYSRTHTCESYEIDQYISEINDYIRKLREYADEARSFAQASISFANEASDFANCESKDAKSQVQ